jgi:small-conductance mechanosensitive channel
MTPKVERTIAWFSENVDALLLGIVIAAILVGIMLIFRAGGRSLVRSDPNCTSWRYVVGRVLAKTSLLFMVVAAVDIVATYAEPPERIGRLFDIAFVIAFALQGAVWGRELALGVIGREVAEDEGAAASTLANAMGVIRVLISVALFAVALIVILDNLGVNVTALIAGLGIGGIAIGLAAQGIFSDLFAALAILFDKPFKRGDTIRYDQSTGTVERIGLKTTRLRSLTGEQLIMANTKLLEREIHNLAEAKARRMTIHFAVEGKAGGAALDTIAAAASEAVEALKGCRLVRCVLSGISSGALAHELVYDDPSRDNDRIARNRSEVLRGLVDRLAAQKLELVQASNIAPPLAPF